MTLLCYACVFYAAAETGKRRASLTPCDRGKCHRCGSYGFVYSTLIAPGTYPERDRLSRSDAVGFSALVLAVALAVAVLLIAQCSEGAQVSLEDWTQSAIRRLPTFYEDNPPGGVAGRTEAKEAQLTIIAAEVARVARNRPPLPPRKWAALLLTIAFHESTFSLRIHAGQCRSHECDHGKARGLFQGHQNLANKPVWSQMQGLENTAVQVAEADRLLRRVVMTCVPPGKAPGDYLRGVFEAYGGQRCGGEWKGADARMATLRRLNP